jgi:hypothetical protein
MQSLKIKIKAENHQREHSCSTLSNLTAFRPSQCRQTVPLMVCNHFDAPKGIFKKSIGTKMQLTMYFILQAFYSMQHAVYLGALQCQGCSIVYNFDRGKKVAYSLISFYKQFQHCAKKRMQLKMLSSS